MIISRQYFEYAFYWADGGKPPASRLAGQIQTAQVGFGSPQQAQQFLRTFHEPHEFRMLLSQRFPGQTYRWRLDELTGKMADLLVKRRLLVIKRWTPAEGGVRGQSAATPAAPRRPIEFAPATESDTFAGNHDPDSQANTLSNAAQDATPFCEECEKSRLAATPPPEPPAETESSDLEENDQKQQAAALANAASSGAAFCEECAKLAAAAASSGEEEAPPPPEPAVLPPNSDEDKQAAALTDAASSGVPFCEECEKLAAAEAKQPEATPPAPVIEGFPEEHDEAAQAATLQKAAESGVPFCEECEKAKQQQQPMAA
ncbi:hypothetical protein F183_A09990 [Bryobacterales bacterium F-183]|nr:hypothetical protein F183_A09990 [Bryobacterales bacterium F-183]